MTTNWEAATHAEVLDLQAEVELLTAKLHALTIVRRPHDEALVRAWRAIPPSISLDNRILSYGRAVIDLATRSAEAAPVAVGDAKKRIQDLMLKWISVPTGAPAKAVWDEIDAALTAALASQAVPDAAQDLLEVSRPAVDESTKPIGRLEFRSGSTFPNLVLLTSALNIADGTLVYTHPAPVASKEAVMLSDDAAFEHFVLRYSGNDNRFLKKKSGTYVNQYTTEWLVVWNAAMAQRDASKAKGQS